MTTETMAACRGLECSALCRMCRRRDIRAANHIDPPWRVAASVTDTDGQIVAVAWSCRAFA